MNVTQPNQIANPKKKVCNKDNGPEPKFGDTKISGFNQAAGQNSVKVQFSSNQKREEEEQVQLESSCDNGSLSVSSRNHVVIQ